MASGSQILKGHVPAAVQGLQPLGRYRGKLHLAIALPLRNQDELRGLIGQLYDSAGPNYRKYLTPAEFVTRFGPTSEAYKAVIEFAKSHGLTISETHPNRMLVDVEGAAPTVEQAFHIRLNVYRHPSEARNFYAPDRDPTVDLVAPVIMHISGLDNYALPRPHLKIHGPISAGSRRAAARLASAPNTGSGPGGTYMGGDFRAAYVPGVTLTGSGQRMGLLEFDGYTTSDITSYENQAGLPSVPLTNVLLDGFTGTPTGSDGQVEVSLDIEVAIAMAPGLSSVIIYEAGPDGNWHDILNRMADDDLAAQMSCSWYIPSGPEDPVADQIFQQMAAQGQSFYAASGDSDAYTGLIPFPGDTPFITEVGGTALTTSGPGGSWLSETVWNEGNGIGGGGGISTQYAIPSWQAPVSMAFNQGSTTMRNTPDVALVADNVSVEVFGEEENVGGTSCAAPLWAAFTALVNQKSVTQGGPTAGFVNPAIYSLGEQSAYENEFHDIETGGNTSSSSPTKFFAVQGYDLCTGWGTPAGAALISALANSSDPLEISAPAFIASGSPAGPFIPNVCTYTLQNTGSMASLTWTVASNQAWTTLSATTGVLAPGASTGVDVSLNSQANSLVAGSYTALLTFADLTTGGSQQRSMTLDVNGPAPALSVTPPTGYDPSGPVGGPFTPATSTYVVSNTGSAPLSWVASNSSSWLSISPTAGTIVAGGSAAVIASVTPAAASRPLGSSTDTIVFSNVSNGVGGASIPCTLMVLPLPPSISSTLAATAVQGSSFSYQITATNNPVSFNATGLPPGLAINTTTGGISGTPLYSGTSTITISASNTGGSGSAGLVLTVLPSAPVINSTLTASATAAQPFTYQVTATNEPTSYGALGLPSGLTLNQNTGLITGAPLTAGSDTIVLSASNAAGTGYATLQLNVAQEPVPAVQTNGTFITAAIFDGTDGATPYGGIVQASDANYYGATAQGGANNDGVVFRLTTGGSLSAIASFNGTNGSGPVGLLRLGSNGYLYGIAPGGGTNGYGTFYEVSLTGSLNALYSFPGDPAPAEPEGLVGGTDGNFYGVTFSGGTNNQGAIFKATPAGQVTQLYSMGGTSGAEPGSIPTFGTDGNIYGITAYGGTNSDGTVYKVTTSGSFSLICNLTAATGYYAVAGITQGNDGNWYCVTTSGAEYGGGSVFRVTPAGAITVLYAFTGGADGRYPHGALYLAPDGNFYGTTLYGGANGYGTLFRMTPSGQLTTLHTFTNSTDGGGPITSLVPGSDGYLYGGAATGGAGYGTIFKFSDAGSVATYAGAAFQYQIVATNDPTSYSVTGSLPSGLALNPSTGLISGTPTTAGTTGIVLNATNSAGTGSADLSIVVQLPPTPVISGILYATAQQGQGFDYQVTASNSPTNYSAAGLPAGLGVNPSTGLISGIPEYSGTTNITLTASNLGGSGTAGFVLTVLPSAPAITSVFTTLATFNYANGSNPIAGVVQGGNGSFYGTTLYGGASGAGTVYELTSSGSLSTLYSFSGGADGGNPWDTLATGTDGNFYGTTYYGGTANAGAIFKISPAGAFSSLCSMASSIGADPIGGLLSGTNGNFYGTATAGGTNGYGAIFQVSSAGLLTNLHSFSNSDGANPWASVSLGNDGNLYGTTLAGGTAGGGALFKMTPGGSLTALSSLSGATGTEPIGGLLQASNGNLYGSVSSGGAYGHGAVFQLSASGSLATLASFNGSDGATPYAALIQGADGNYYGTTAFGGNGSEGTIFQITSVGAITSLYSFTGGADGAEPWSALTQGADGRLYGATYTGGTSGYGTVYAIAPPYVTGSAGYPLSYQVGATNIPIAYSASGLPPGLSMNSGTGLISGAPTATGTFSTTVAASNTAGSGSGTLTFLILPAPPVLTSPAGAAGIQGQPFTYQITAINPVAGFSAQGLPAGLTVNPSTGLISGTPSVPGEYAVLLSASNVLGSNAASLSLLVQTTDAYWGIGWFGNSAPANVSGDSAINNPAGIPNLLAYALGLDPYTAGANALPIPGAETISGNTYLTVSFVQNALASDVTYTVEASNVLTSSTSWTPVSVFTAGAWSPAWNVTETGTGTSMNVQVRDLQPIGPLTPSRFLRLRVTH
jgi:uncharacterized repeat protein (TIGR03803 family)